MSAKNNTENNIGFVKKLDLWAGRRGPIPFFTSGFVAAAIIFAFVTQFFIIPYFDKFYTEKERQIENLRNGQIDRETKILELKNESAILRDSISTIRSFGQFYGSYKLTESKNMEFTPILGNYLQGNVGDYDNNIANLYFEIDTCPPRPYNDRNPCLKLEYDHYCIEGNYMPIRIGNDKITIYCSEIKPEEFVRIDIYVKDH
ncbi:MAG: hypothetical protein JRJ85_24760 [Deltaproteobacteria bacterium]|nr:hypothetical protein [Deltaproteobacteria bacterium]